MTGVRKRRRVWRMPRAEWLGAVTGVLALGLLAGMAVLLVDMSNDLRGEQSARDALARQVQQLGGKPVAGPPGSRGEPGPSVVGPSGPPGSTGPPGASGDPGSPGPSGSPGKAGATGSPGTPGSPGQVGVSGSPGTSGTDGAAGSPGPAGPQGEPGPAGPVGERGPQGDPGETGATGPPPSGWTWTDSKGVTYECTPDGDGSTHYTCRAVDDPEPSDSPQGGLLGLAVLTGSAAYRRL